MSENHKFYSEITPKPYKKTGSAKPTDQEQEVPLISKNVAKPKKNLFGKFGLLLTIFLFLPLIVAYLFIFKVGFTIDPKEALLTDLDAVGIPVGDHYYMLPGSYKVSFSALGYHPKTFLFDVTLGDDNQFIFELEKKPGHLVVSVVPQTDASVWLDGTIKGKAPMTVNDIPAGEHIVEIRAEGYETTSNTVSITGLDKTQTFTAELTRDTPPRLNIISLPGGAAVNINNQFVGLTPIVYSMKANQEYQLMVVKPGYSIVKESVKLKPKEQKAIEFILQPNKKNKAKPPPPIQKKSRKTIESKLGLEFVVFDPKSKEITYSKGRLSYTALLSRAFAVSKTEITNKQFRAFISSHSSGDFQGNSLDGDNKPVVNVSWSEAALFSNWLSKQAGIDLFYTAENSKVTGFKPESVGYRLVSEAEWMSILQGEYQYRYLWGNDFERIGDKSGNYADKSAVDILSTTLEYYNDTYPVSADVGKFYPNKYGIYDIEGNVAEWLHDIFTISSYEERLNPLGPAKGVNHVIRGGSWKYGTRRMLSTSYRQYNVNQGKPEVGFRIAYYLK